MSRTWQGQRTELDRSADSLGTIWLSFPIVVPVNEWFILCVIQAHKSPMLSRN